MDSFLSSPLAISLSTSLASRDAREIRRRLPNPETQSLIDFTSNDYLSLSSSPHLRSLFLKKLTHAPHILGSGGSRLLVNGKAHVQLEARLENFFGCEEALLFNSGFDANVAFFECVPQPGDVVVYDDYVHASVHDGMKASRVGKDNMRAFTHNDVDHLATVLMEAKKRLEREMGVQGASVFVAVESVYSMDGTLAPLKEMCAILEDVFGKGSINGYLVVDEAHATGLYGPQGRGRVSMLGLENKVLARLCTFGKALAASGAVLLTNRLIRDYMLNYARPLIYTTALSYATVLNISCSFDLLQDGTTETLANHLFNLIQHFLLLLQPHLSAISPDILSLPAHLSKPSLTRDDLSPVIPLHTQYPRPLSAYLLKLGMNARPITWPTVPKGKDRVRVCLHAGNTTEDVERLVSAVMQWASGILNERNPLNTLLVSPSMPSGVALASKL
ncbi:hypothetical protein M378DRAFT_78315 [Amanita muscaria Koide BX008]|uniref:Aminotransferase class I/classII large domain-containing protein n=1 Tax=Amanita muscaria (strain Koide BX008) TaxID=946122 RepID=A0A0C2X550_AMAMK|nr:hypothetical protein M378DRAFT_78315 [Amanita muscaria Koide BX008]